MYGSAPYGFHPYGVINKPQTGPVVIDLLEADFKTEGGELSSDLILSVPSFNIESEDLLAFADKSHVLSTPGFTIQGAELKTVAGISTTLTTPVFSMTPGGLLVSEPPVGEELLTADFRMSAGEMGYPENVKMEVVKANFKFNAETVDMAGQYTLKFDTLNGTYAGAGLTVRLGGSVVATVTSNGSHAFHVLAGVGSDIEFVSVLLNEFIGDLDNISLQEGFREL